MYIIREWVEWSKWINGLGREGKRKEKGYICCALHRHGPHDMIFFLYKLNKESQFQTLKQNVGPKPENPNFL